MDKKEKQKIVDSIVPKCTADAKCEDRSPKHSDSDGTDIRDTPAYWKGWDDAMKQKEQKHPNGCFTCDEYKKGYEAGRLNGFTAGYNKAMKEVDQKEQKPAEWSEEDEEHINSIFSDFKQNVIPDEEDQKWLKNRSFLSTLESEKPLGLEEEIHKYNKERFDEYFPEQDGDFISEVDFMTCLDRVARHFAQWGAEHSGSSEIPNDLKRCSGHTDLRIFDNYVRDE